MNTKLIAIGPHVVNVEHLLYAHILTYRGKEGEVKKRTFKITFTAGESLEIAEDYFPEVAESFRLYMIHPVEQEQPELAHP